MPRRTVKSKTKNGNINLKISASKNTKQAKNVEKNKSLKKELPLDPPKEIVTEEVFHRKSERRRVARDIFLVFEEESSFRRSRSSKKHSKPKFGHLKVEGPSKPKGLLKDIKNEPKCFPDGSNVNVILPHSAPILKESSKILNVREEKCLKTVTNKASKCKVADRERKSNKLKSLKISTLKTKECACETEPNFVARVNPIFLWVKQDDTRIVEVRCEDYDKRNRIRLTKTTNGWRAIPRSDPTTSRILKFYPTPLMKVKRENDILETSSIPCSKIQEKNAVICKEFAIQNLLSDHIADKIESKLEGSHTVCNPLANKIIKSKKKKSKNAKTLAEKIVKKSKTITTAETNITVNNEVATTNLSLSFSKSSAKLELPVEMTAKVESSVNIQLTPNTYLDTNKLAGNLNGQIYEKIGKNLETNIISSSPTPLNVIPSLTKSTYQSETEKETFYLCPKTGLFLPNHFSITEYEDESGEKINENAFRTDRNNYLVSSKSNFNMDIDRAIADSKLQLSDENTESLEAKTKNLKDLLDDADLLQHCDDNANSDADLIDTLVKTSCENNLIQANEIITKANVDQIEHKNLQETNDMVVQLIAEVSNPPKCLSFNEAGEIEGLNEELFQSNTFLEAFDKPSPDLLRNSQDTLHSTVEASVPPHKTSLYASMGAENIEKNNSQIQTTSEIEESPKDLSYKKREEVCPQSESRSQCAVTSSSDVIKSPQNGDSTSLGSQSETLKNLILEQFMKLNALTAHHREPIDLDSVKHSDISNSKSVYSSEPRKSGGVFETVVIDDDENESEEPLKKRMRLNKHKVISGSVTKLSMINEDPDPLTQLRLLVRNSQWKVPDPILVPKDRLSAVLASPAREIPLLITTRPELRLPEAFAYPEIIQNPNILVISMAQLEAILKNNVGMESSVTVESVKTNVNDLLSSEQLSGHLTKRAKESDLLSPMEHFQRVSKPVDTFKNTRKSESNLNSDQFNESGPLPALRDNSKIPQTDSCSSDLNSATMKVLNQMFWLPYFGHMSQDIGKSINSPISLQEKCSNDIPSFNSQFSGITNLEEFFRRANHNKTSEKSLSNDGRQNFEHQIKTNEELSLFQKIVQHQMHSVLQLNQLPVESSKLIIPVTQENILHKSKSKIGSSNLFEQRKQKAFLSNKQGSTYLCKNHTNNINNNSSAPEKSYNLRSSVAGRHSIEHKQYTNSSQRQLPDNKPRLTCKSLSNLLDPEHNTVPSPSCSVPYIQSISGFLKSDNEYKRNLVESKVVNESIAEKNTQFVTNVPNVPQTHKKCGIINGNVEPNNETNRQKTKSFETMPLISDTPTTIPDANVPLWHPLFGSNTKTGYSSPWQWTTVTATGE